MGWGPLGRGGSQNSLWAELRTAGAQPTCAHPGTRWPGRAFAGKARVCVSNWLGGAGRHRGPWVQGCSQWSGRGQRAESHIQGGSCPVCPTRTRCRCLSRPRKPPHRPARPLTTEAPVRLPTGRARSMGRASSPLLLAPPSGPSRPGPLACGLPRPRPRLGGCLGSCSPASCPGASQAHLRLPFQLPALA